MTSSSVAWMTSVCPRPPNMISSIERSQPASQPSSSYQPSTVVSFSRESGSSLPVIVQTGHDHARGCGMLNPAMPATVCAGFPTVVVLMAPFGMEQQFAQPFGLFFIGEIGAVLRSSALSACAAIGLSATTACSDGADGGAVKRFAVDDVAGGFFQVSAAVHIHRHIARANAIGRFADRMGGFHHRAAAGRQDQAHAFVFQ